MEQRPFGTTGLTVSALDLGAGQLGLDPARLDRDEFGLRFAACAPNVDCVIAGTTRLGNLHRNGNL